jgi:hypothetical protein
MAIKFCTMPAQYDKMGYYFPKLRTQLMFPKIQIMYLYVYIFIKRPIIAVCYTLIAVFPGSALISTKLLRTPAYFIYKEIGKIKIPENSKFLLLLWYLA